MMNKLKINLFGELWKLTQLNLTAAEYEIMQSHAVELKTTINDVLLDVCFSEINVFSGILSYPDLKHSNICGLLNTYKNQIEIWYAGKKIKKIGIRDLVDDYLLFPLYNSITSRLSYYDLPKGVYIEQKEIGLVVSYETFIDHFKLNDIEFNILKVEKHELCFDLLNNINHVNQILTKIESIDSLITNRVCFEV